MHDSLQQRRLNFRDIVRLTLVLVFVTFCTISLIFLVNSYLLKSGIIKESIISGWIFFAAESFSLWLSIKYTLINNRNFSWKDLGIKEVSARWVLIGILLCLLIYSVSFLINYIFAKHGIWDNENSISEILPLFPISLHHYLLSIFFGAFTVPIVEEIIFRGILFKWIRYRLDLFYSSILSSLIFTMVHPPGAGNPLQIFIIGLILAWLYEKTGSLWPSIALHCCNNFVGISFIYFAVSWGWS